MLEIRIFVLPFLLRPMNQVVSADCVASFGGSAPPAFL
jgi:hypothetical protein